MKTVTDQRLTEEKINSLLNEYLKSRDVQIKDKIVIQYKSLVENIARRFLTSGEPLEDLVQEGYIGLITAVDLYNSSKGVKFSTYSTHFIIGQIKHALRDRGKIIKEPAWLQELNHRMAKVIDALYQEYGRQPTNAEVGKAMHMPDEQVADMLTTREIFKVASLDIDQDEATSGGVDLDKVKDDRYTSFQLPIEDKVVLEMAMNKLKVIEQKVIQEFYFSSLNQTEIAKKLGISCNYVSHILRSGTRKLRQILTTEEIREIQTQLQLASRHPENPADAMLGVTDSLTGLYNGDYLESRLSEELTRATRDKVEVAFMVVSIYGLEDYGIKYGTMQRDDVLCSLSQTVKNTVRRCDIVGRLGGAELGLVLLYTNGCVELACDRVTEAIQNQTFEAVRGHAKTRFSAHTGFAVYPGESSNAKELIELARASLQQAMKETKKAA